MTRRLTEKRKWIELATMCALLLSILLIALAESRSIRSDKNNSTRVGFQIHKFKLNQLNFHHFNFNFNRYLQVNIKN